MSNSQRDSVLLKATHIEILTAKEVAVMVRAKPSTVYAWAKEGNIPAIKLNGLIRFDLKEIAEWLSQNKIKPVDIDIISRQIRNQSNNIDIERIVKRSIDTFAVSDISYFEGETRSNQARKGGH